MSDTVEVRIAVVVDAENPENVGVELLRADVKDRDVWTWAWEEASEPVTETRYIVTAKLPLPAPVEVAGEVEEVSGE